MFCILFLDGGYTGVYNCESCLLTPKIWTFYYHVDYFYFSIYKKINNNNSTWVLVKDFGSINLGIGPGQEEL